MFYFLPPVMRNLIIANIAVSLGEILDRGGRVQSATMFLSTSQNLIPSICSNQMPSTSVRPSCRTRDTACGTKPPAYFLEVTFATR